MSHPPPSISRHQVTCLSLKNASAPWGQTVARWPLITISRVSYIQYLLACQKSQRSNPYNMVKSGLTWRRVFRRRHLGRRVTAVTCLRWPTVNILYHNEYFRGDWASKWCIPHSIRHVALRNLRASGLTQCSWRSFRATTLSYSCSYWKIYGGTWGTPHLWIVHISSMSEMDEVSSVISHSGWEFQATVSRPWGSN